MNYLAAAILGYLLGSFPTAYILIKKSRGIDITIEGSGNVGAMNSFEVSRSKMIGIIVFAVDALKGLLSVYLSLLLFQKDFIFPALALIFAVLSHCYNPWLNFKGGRGLAAAAGGVSLLFPVILAIWAVVWSISYIIKKDILLSNILSNILTLFIIFIFSNFTYEYSFPKADSISSILLFSTTLLILVQLKHIDPLKEIIKNKSFFQKGKSNV